MTRKVVLVTVLEVKDSGIVTLELCNGNRLVRPLNHFTTFIYRGNSIKRGVSLYTNL